MKKVILHKRVISSINGMNSKTNSTAVPTTREKSCTSRLNKLTSGKPTNYISNYSYNLNETFFKASVEKKIIIKKLNKIQNPIERSEELRKKIDNNNLSFTYASKSRSINNKLNTSDYHSFHSFNSNLSVDIKKKNEFNRTKPISKTPTNRMQVGITSSNKAKLIQSNTINVKNPLLLKYVENKKNINNEVNRPYTYKTIPGVKTKNIICTKTSTSAHKENNTSPLVIKRLNKQLNVLSNEKPKVSNFATKKDAPGLGILKQYMESKLNKIDAINSISFKLRNISCISKIGFANGANKKVNQDNFFIHQNFLSQLDFYLIGVMDGHGLYGHDVSGFVKDNMPGIIKDEIENKNNFIDDDTLNRALESSFSKTNSLLTRSEIDTTFSGSTCAIIILTPEKVVCANIGDSRIVIGKQQQNTWISQDLSRDHKPTEKDESDRIMQQGGRIEPCRDESDSFVGPERIWLKDDDVPGLAMTRSFGDRVAASVGVTSKPEIIHKKLTCEDKFIILASDGLWEFIESQECVNMIQSFYNKNDISGALQYLLKESNDRWLNSEDVIDDTTIIIVFL